jgi:hypothetical protein
MRPSTGTLARLRRQIGVNGKPIPVNSGHNYRSCSSLSFSSLAILTAAAVVIAAASLSQGKDMLAMGKVLGVLKGDIVEASTPAWDLDQINGRVKATEVSVEASSGRVKRPKDPIVIGYAISLIKCSDKQSFPAGLVDAALVLRHSIHLTSVRHAPSGSLYDYQMFAIIHSNVDKEGCAKPLEEAGFTILVKDTPIQRDEIQGEFLRKTIHREWCCGADEFIKLHAYTIPDVPIVVHVDLDFVMLRPMDDLFDAMLYRKDSDIGRKARARISMEFSATPWPDQVDTFMTRDWPQVMPGRKPGYQAGFLVTKPNATVFDLMINVIREGNYVEGYSRENGWGGLGYGAFVGAMAMQGLLAYVYDALLPTSWVELNQCRHNHMGMDVLYRAAPTFRPHHPKVRRNCELRMCEAWHYPTHAYGPKWEESCS